MLPFELKQRTLLIDWKVYQVYQVVSHLHAVKSPDISLKSKQKHNVTTQIWKKKSKHLIELKKVTETLAWKFLRFVEALAEHQNCKRCSKATNL